MRLPQHPQIRIPENRYTVSSLGEVRVSSPDALHQIKILTGDQCFVGIRDTHPLGGGALLHLLDLVMRRTLFALHQRSGVGLSCKMRMMVVADHLQSALSV